MGGDDSYNVTLRNLLWLDASAPSLLDSSRQLRSGAHGRKFVVSFADSGPNYCVKTAYKPVDVHTSYDSWLYAVFPCPWARSAANFTTNIRKDSKAEGLLSGLRSAVCEPRFLLSAGGLPNFQALRVLAGFCMDFFLSQIKKMY